MDYKDLARAEWDRRAKEGPQRYTAGNTEGVEDDFDQIGRHKVEVMLGCFKEHPLAQWSALEVGCGIGQLMERVAPEVKSVAGADISSEMIRRCGARLARFPNVSLQLIPGDGSIPGPDAAFDLAYCISVFHHVPKPVFFGYVEGLRRHIKPGGWFFFQLTRPYTIGRKLRALFGSHPPDCEAWKSRYYTEGAMKRLAARAGYEWVKVIRDPRNLFFLWKRP